MAALASNSVRPTECPKKPFCPVPLGKSYIYAFSTALLSIRLSATFTSWVRGSGYVFPY